MKGIKRVKVAYTIFSVCLLLFGLFVFIYPKISIQIIYKIGGAMFIGFGIIKMAGYFSKDIFQLAFQHDLAMGIVSIFIGFIMLFQTENIIHMLAVAISLFMIVDALLKIQTALDAKKFGIQKWWLILVIGFGVAIVGGILFFQPFRGTKMIIRFLGFIILIDGILNLCVVQSTVTKEKERELWELQMK